MSYWGRFPRYVSVAEKKAKAEKRLKKLMKKNPDIKPVALEGRTIARTWWGKSWNTNLERYADYSNRIGRGRSYIRNGAVLDLRIEPGKVTSLVQGTASKPYAITVKIKNIKKDIWKTIKSECEGKLDSLQELLGGKFPKALAEIFTTQGLGLFPTPGEIEFDCSCPDWADMCKHVAATLYGIGARLDEDPGLFFKLRKAEIGDLVTQAVKAKTKKLLDKAKVKSKRVMSDSNLSDIFGIEMEGDTAAKSSRKTKTSAKKSAKKVKKVVKRSTAKKVKKVVKKIVKKSTAKKGRKVVKKSLKKSVASVKKSAKKVRKVVKKVVKKSAAKKVKKVVKKVVKSSTAKKRTKVLSKGKKRAVKKSVLKKKK